MDKDNKVKLIGKIDQWQLYWDDSRKCYKLVDDLRIVAEFTVDQYSEVHEKRLNDYDIKIHSWVLAMMPKSTSPRAC